MSAENGTPVRVRLLEVGAKLLAEEGPGALSARRVATEVGASTMVVYTHFGSMRELVRSVAGEGFARLATNLAEVPATADAVADIARQGLAYRRTALENPHLYAVMFASASLGGYRPTGDDLNVGRETFEVLVASTSRAIDAGRFRAADPVVAAAQLWSALHGFVMLELAGYFGEGNSALRRSADVLLPLFANQIVGLGDHPDAVARSLAGL